MPWPWTTMARLAPSILRLSAIRSSSSASETPITWALTPAGLARGPRMLNAVRKSRLLRIGWTNRIAGWNFGANMKPMWASRMHSATTSGPGVDIDAQLLEHIGRAATAGDPAVAVLGDVGARARRHEGGGRGDIERLDDRAARAAGVDQVREIGLDSHRVVPQRLGQPGDLARRWPVSSASWPETPRSGPPRPGLRRSCPAGPWPGRRSGPCR